MLSTIKQTYLSRIRCRYLSFIVPLGSILVLLLLCVTLINPSSNGSSKAYADEPVVLAATDTPSASLTIANPELSGYGKVGELVTVSSNVTVVGNLISSYSLQISGSNSNTISDSNGNIILEGPSTINPINNTTYPTGISGNNMPSDTWGYMWGDTNDSNNKYKGITTTPVTIESNTIGNSIDDSSSDSSNNGTISITKPLTFAVKFSKDAIAGHYSTKVNLLLTATPRILTTYTLTYDLNGGSINNNTTNPTDTCSTYFSSCDVTITSTIPTKDGYTFLGWGDNTTTINSNYGSGKTIAISADKTIYAIWDKVLFNGITTMQEMTTDICSSASIGDETTLMDNRDYPNGVDKTYTIAKLPDGKCWMTENLRISGTGSNGQVTSSNSNGTPKSGWILPTSNDSGFDNNAISNVFYAADRGGVKGTSYYSWCSATAGTCSSVATYDGANAPASICPKNWKLPTGGSSKTTDFYNLFNHIDKTIFQNNTLKTDSSTQWATPKVENLAKIQASPYYFIFSGYIYVHDGLRNFVSEAGSWWSSTVRGGDYVYHLNIGAYDVTPGFATDARKNGYAVRCVAQ